MRHLARLLPLLVVLVALPSAAHAQSVTTYTANLSHPWDLAFLPDGRALLHERAGRVLLLDAEGRVDRPTLQLPPVAREGGAGLAARPRVRGQPLRLPQPDRRPQRGGAPALRR